MARQNAGRARPLVKWMGSKQRLLQPILDCIRDAQYTGTYYEPFVGGGSVLLALQPKKAVINDLNGQLVNLWRWVQSDVEAVIGCWLSIDPPQITEEHFYRLRDEHNEHRRTNATGPHAAAVFAWVVQHSFNGLYRVRKDGAMNANWNKAPYSTTWHLNAWREVAGYLRNADVKILCGDFSQAIETCAPGDLIYADPPYTVGPMDRVFSAYVYGGFDINKDSVRVAEALAKVPCAVVVSNNDNSFSRQLFAPPTWGAVPLEVQRCFHGSIGRVDYSKRREVLFTKNVARPRLF